MKKLWVIAFLGLPLAARAAETTTPIQYVVVLFQENVSFDHYFATYPHANGLTEDLLKHNPNTYQPFLLTRAQALTCDQDHSYTHEQQAMNNGRMDKFVEYTDNDNPRCDDGVGPKLVMGYYDGTTVTALWDYARRFAMSDNFFNTVYGPSTPAAINLISGQTHGVQGVQNAPGIVSGTLIGDWDPAFDDCIPATAGSIAMEGQTVADLLNAKNITWGWFQGGFADCKSAHKNIGGATVRDYVPHHEPFQYFKPLANPQHRPPASIEEVGQNGQANHQYDLADFWRAAKAGHLPHVSFLKPPAYQNGHAGYSDPLDEQRYLVETINALQKLPEWSSMAVFLTYDDSDGWYDHVMPPLVSHSKTKQDALTGPGECGVPGARDLYPGRCGYGPRLPLLVLSPWAKKNYIDHTLTDQTSILRFIEDNWRLGRIGGSSFDAIAGSLEGLFDFKGAPDPSPIFLDSMTGQLK